MYRQNEDYFRNAYEGINNFIERITDGGVPRLAMGDCDVSDWYVRIYTQEWDDC